jgi:hypothetical protein
MAKIENWNKTFISSSASRLIVWRNSKTFEQVELSNAGKDWAVDVNTKDKILSAYYPTRKEAMDRAIRYMKKHTRG